jgi:hypothetical protein
MSAQETVVTGYDELMSIFLSLCPLLLLDPQLDCDLFSLELNSELDWGGGFSSDNLDGRLTVNMLSLGEDENTSLVLQEVK